jgi:hypothetical protein
MALGGLPAYRRTATLQYYREALSLNNALITNLIAFSTPNAQIHDCSTLQMTAWQKKV